LWPSYRPRTIVGPSRNQPGPSFRRDRPAADSGAAAPPALGRLPRRSSANGLGKWNESAWQAWLVSGPCEQQPWAAPFPLSRRAPWGEANQKASPEPTAPMENPAKPPACLSQHTNRTGRRTDAPGWLNFAVSAGSGSPCGNCCFLQAPDGMMKSAPPSGGESLAGPPRNGCSAGRSPC